MRIQKLMSRLLKHPGIGKRGVALVEFALVLPFIIIMAMGTIDFGRLIQTRLIISNVSREGGSVASRQVTVDAKLVDLLVASGVPLKLDGPDGKVVVTRIAAGVSVDKPNPTIEAQFTGGGLNAAGGIGAGNQYLGLPQNLYDHLVFRPAHNTSDISEITVVEVYYNYRHVTPLPAFARGILGNIVFSSKAIF